MSFVLDHGTDSTLTVDEQHDSAKVITGLFDDAHDTIFGDNSHSNLYAICFSSTQRNEVVSKIDGLRANSGRYKGISLCGAVCCQLVFLEAIVFKKYTVINYSLKQLGIFCQQTIIQGFLTKEILKLLYLGVYFSCEEGRRVCPDFFLTLIIVDYQKKTDKL